MLGLTTASAVEDVGLTGLDGLSADGARHGAFVSASSVAASNLSRAKRMEKMKRPPMSAMQSRPLL